MDLSQITAQLVQDVQRLRFGPPVTHVYNPLAYAGAAYAQYAERLKRHRPKVLLLGMNPGPWGMAQTGVPFGEVSAVRDWLKIREGISRPENEHPKRPVLGLDCKRSEVSGARLWGWARRIFGTPDKFFRRFFILNYCPLAFMEESGRNRTPDKLPTKERAPLFDACDRALRHTVELIQPRYVVGVGRFAEHRAEKVLQDLGITIGAILHPSPANPRANRDWSSIAAAQLETLGISLE